MRPRLGLPPVVAVSALVLLLCAAATGASEVSVTEGRVEVTASGQPLADVLQKLGEATGMKVVIEGPAPRQPLRAHVVAATAAEAVLSLLEGQGLSYALLYDASGTHVETLLLTGPAGVSPRPAEPAPPVPRGRPQLPRPPVDEDPDAGFEEPPEELEELEEPPEEPDATAPEVPVGAPTPIPAPSFPRSPFTPGPEAAPLFPAPPTTTPGPVPSPTPQDR